MSTFAILVSSFDDYSVCWQPFCHGIQKYWPENSQPIYFITNQKEAPGGISLKTGQDRGWANNLRYALECIPEEFILYAQEDYWINNPVDVCALNDYLFFLQSGRVDYIRLYPAPPADIAFSSDDRLGILLPDSAYRTSLQMALWRKSTLMELLKPDETPWQFEIQGSHRSRKYGERFLCVRKRQYGIQYVFTAIVDGEWSSLAFDYARQEGLSIRFEDLPKKPFIKMVCDRVRGVIHHYKKKLRFLR